MSATVPLGLRYPPATGVTPDVPRDLGYLASDVQDVLGRLTASALQEGVVDGGSFEVTQASGGASMILDIASNVGRGALVQKDSTSCLYPIVPTAVKSTVTVGTAHASNPRVDRVVVSVTGTVSLVAGSASGGATLDNLTGAPAVPADSLLLADVLVPATDTTISNSQIRDRRRWARGAHAQGGGPSVSSADAGSTMTEIVSSRVRLECSGVPVRVKLSGGYAIADTKVGRFDLFIDGTTATSNHYRQGYGQGATGNFLDITWTVTPTAGSHVFALALASADGVTSLFVEATEFTVEEDLRAFAENNATTTG